MVVAKWRDHGPDHEATASMLQCAFDRSFQERQTLHTLGNCGVCHSFVRAQWSFGLGHNSVSDVTAVCDGYLEASIIGRSAQII